MWAWGKLKNVWPQRDRKSESEWSNTVCCSSWYQLERGIILPTPIFQIYLVQPFFKFWKYLSCFIMVHGNNLSHPFFSLLLFLKMWINFPKDPPATNIYSPSSVRGLLSYRLLFSTVKPQPALHNTWQSRKIQSSSAHCNILQWGSLEEHRIQEVGLVPLHYLWAWQEPLLPSCL